MVLSTTKPLFLYRTAFIVMLLVMINGCSTRTHSVAQHQQVVSSDLDKLYPYHNAWHTTPYKFGGTGAKGIDCSSFVQRAYYDLFKIRLPRTTAEQVKKGKKVSRNNIRTSDLVFFKTGYNTRHVGIYLQNGDFMHASSSNGVIISSLKNSYWSKHYWMTRRYK